VPPKPAASSAATASNVRPRPAVRLCLCMCSGWAIPMHSLGIRSRLVRSLSLGVDVYDMNQFFYRIQIHQKVKVLDDLEILRRQLRGDITPAFRAKEAVLQPISDSNDYH
jgi:hypothetical protein